MADKQTNTAIERLKVWGFVEKNGGWERPTRSGAPKTRIELTEGGCFRYEREDGVWRKYPQSIHPEWEGIAGLAFDAKQGATDPNSKVKPECFEWVNPIAWLIDNYGNEPSLQKKR